MPGPRIAPHHLALATALLLAAGTAGCGSAAEAVQETGGGTAAAATTGEDGPPAKDAAAIRAALDRTDAAWANAKTARLESTTGAAGDSTRTTASGVVDLPGERYLLREQIGGLEELTSWSYGERPRAYLLENGPPSAENTDWELTAKDDVGTGPTGQVRLIEKAVVVAAGDTAEMAGETCRWFDGRVKVLDQVADASGAANVAKLRKDPDRLEEVLGDDPEEASTPFRACVDDHGLVYAFDQDFDAAKEVGGLFGKTGRVVLKLRLSQYGTAKAFGRPAGIDGAKIPEGLRR